MIILCNTDTKIDTVINKCNDKVLIDVNVEPSYV